MTYNERMELRRINQRRVEPKRRDWWPLVGALILLGSGALSAWATPQLWAWIVGVVR